MWFEAGSLYLPVLFAINLDHPPHAYTLDKSLKY
jgi:hypothetical protein